MLSQFAFCRKLRDQRLRHDQFAQVANAKIVSIRRHGVFPSNRLKQGLKDTIAG